MISLRLHWRTRLGSTSSWSATAWGSPQRRFFSGNGVLAYLFDISSKLLVVQRVWNDPIVCFPPPPSDASSHSLATELSGGIPVSPAGQCEGPNDALG